MALILVGLLMMATLDTGTSYFPMIFLTFVVQGTGIGLALAPLSRLGMRDVPRGEVGLASGMLSVSVQIGGAFGLAIISTIATDHTSTLMANGTDRLDALVDGFQLGYLISSCFLALALLLTVIATRENTRGP
jgi:hypothetical protein